MDEWSTRTVAGVYKNGSTTGEVLGSVPHDYVHSKPWYLAGVKAQGAFVWSKEWPHLTLTCFAQFPNPSPKPHVIVSAG